MGNVRGAAAQAAKNFVLENYGQEGLDQLMARLDEGQRKILAVPLPVSWLDAPTMIRFFETINELFGDGTEAIYRRIGQFNASRDIKSYYKFILALSSPALVLNRLPALWSAYYDTGILTVQVSGNRAEAVMTGFEDAGVPCQIVCGFAEKTIEMTGGKNPHVEHEECVANGGPICRFVFTWD